MVAFRKCLPVLAVLALLLSVSMQANAQTTGAFSCNAAAGVPTTVRSQGIAELVGDVILNCTGGITATPFVANFTIFLNTNITSKLISGNTSEALLLVDEPGATGSSAAPVTGTNVFNGTITGPNQVSWFGITVTPPGPTGTTRVLRFTNIRANASAVGLAPSGTFIPNQISMFITATGTQSIPVNNPTQIVAFVTSGQTFDLRNCANSGSASAQAVQQCSGTNTTLAGDNTSSPGTFAFAARFQEGFATAFKPMGTATGQTVPGASYNTESGVGLGLSGSGQATQGTRLMLRFNNIPQGLQVFVTVSNLVGSGLSTTGASAVLVSVSDATGTSGAAATPVSQTGTLGSACATNSTLGIVSVTMTGGAGAATYEVTAANANALDTLLFGVVFAGKPNTASNLPALGTGTVTGSFAPINTTATASSSAPVPRFADVPTTVNAVTVNACVTNLLFPYVTSAPGFDTGIAISNTSADPFGTVTQAGACTINYFTGGTTAAPAAATSGTIAAGSQLIFTLFSGNTAQGIAATPNFTGYLIAQCKFQFAHGFAFVSDLGSQKLAMGYLPLVIPTSVGGARAAVDTAVAGSASESLNP